MLSFRLILTAGLLATLCYADTVFEIKFNRYENLLRELSSGGFCDGNQNDGCETYFNICVYDPSSSIRSCPYGEWQTKVLGDAVLDLASMSYLPVEPSGQISNPLVLTISGALPELFGIRIEAMDSNGAGTAAAQKTYFIQRMDLLPSRFDEAHPFHVPSLLTFDANGAALSIQTKSYCQTGFVGRRCEIPCIVPAGDFTRWTCNSNGQRMCRPPFTGTMCNLANPCSYAHYCKNGGTCNPPQTSADTKTCTCAPGYGGQFCEIANPCFYAPCKNGGTCNPPQTSADTMTCTCAPGYGGQFCDRPTEEDRWICFRINTSDENTKLIKGLNDGYASESILQMKTLN